MGEKSKSKFQAINASDAIADALIKRGMKKNAFADLVGFKNPNVVAMITAGKMNLPIKKIIPSAIALGIDPYYLIRCSDHQYDNGLVEIVDSIAGRMVPTKNEEQLIKAIRNSSHGMDLDFAADHPEAFRNIMAAVERAVSQAEKVTAKAVEEATK